VPSIGTPPNSVREPTSSGHARRASSLPPRDRPRRGEPEAAVAGLPGDPRARVAVAMAEGFVGCAMPPSFTGKNAR